MKIVVQELYKLSQLLFAYFERIHGEKIIFYEDCYWWMDEPYDPSEKKEFSMGALTHDLDDIQAVLHDKYAMSTVALDKGVAILMYMRFMLDNSKNLQGKPITELSVDKFKRFMNMLLRSFENALGDIFEVQGTHYWDIKPKIRYDILDYAAELNPPMIKGSVTDSMNSLRQILSDARAIESADYDRMALVFMAVRYQVEIEHKVFSVVYKVPK